jgi:flagellin-like protein
LSQTSFYLVFVIGVTLLAVAGGFTLAAFAMTQGEFQPETRRGLASLIGVLLLVGIVVLSALKLNHVVLPH